MLLLDCFLLELEQVNGAALKAILKATFEDWEDILAPCLLRRWTRKVDLPEKARQGALMYLGVAWE